MSEKSWVSSNDYTGPGKWEEALQKTGLGKRPTTKQPKPKAYEKRRPNQSSVNVTKADPKVLREALKLAEGDASRLTVEPDGSITVNNASRRKGNI